MEYVTDFGKLVWFFLPAGVANMAPVLVKHHWNRLAVPIHSSWFGDHKTWRGIIAATIFGGVFFAIQKMLAMYTGADNWSYYDYELFPYWFGFCFGLGAITGDLIKSYFKRRLHIKPGAAWFPFDQIDFAVGATLVVLLFAPVQLIAWLMIIGGAIGFHFAMNQIGFRLKLKDHPW